VQRVGKTPPKFRFQKRRRKVDRELPKNERYSAILRGSCLKINYFMRKFVKKRTMSQNKQKRSTAILTEGKNSWLRPWGRGRQICFLPRAPNSL